MTTDKKELPAFYIFATDESGKDKIVGRGYRHKKGDGFNLLIEGKRFKAFPPRTAGDATTGEEGA